MTLNSHFALLFSKWNRLAVMLWFSGMVVLKWTRDAHIVSGKDVAHGLWFLAI